ncbi:hypothetical protein N802_19055 [Knoellia sinensis KCTC 19936]|uniref:Uncharacterized protein n=1 Tax=Knoellia sinensis KCTC 19936 TaxID=1385520 RepID=A0A0A0J7C1_9MICO|nr:hypothetical protein [Knoellia sinensis]KGN31952.1 hypothetical protein N802_19055 [Knoellia sinensis KCTC 19936]
MGLANSVPKLSLEEASGLVGATIRACEILPGSDGKDVAEAFVVDATKSSAAGFPQMVSFDGGPLPDGCSVSHQSRLFLLSKGRWVEARQVGCGANAS